MHLKRIEIKGFKSFADKTVIDFEQGVTAVVGPNGSGKSNITEALRWVLGEQSVKSLRGGKMHDVIFAGSEARKPLNIAEVTVILDNQDRYFALDFSEISVTRRITRTGDSDFYINKKTCRLRDIQELFMDSGLGKESFSIISQGKVEAIFNSKPEERRGIFEEAAGVLKYKSRKKEAEKKLFETEDNLNRLEDIIYELEEQLAPLEEQSQIANQYQKLHDELIEVDVNVTVAEISKHKIVFEEKKALVAEFTQKTNELLAQVQTKETQLMVGRNQRMEINQRLENLQSQFVAITERHKEAQGEQNVLKERGRHAEENAQDLENALSEVLNSLMVLSEEIDAIANQLTDKEDELACLEEEKEKALEQLEELSKPSKELIAELRADYVELAQKEVNVQNDLKYLERQYESESKNNERFITQYEEIKEKLTLAHEEEKQANEHLSKKTLEITQQIEAFKAQQTTLIEQQQLYDNLQSQMYQKMNETSQVKARLKSLKDIQENYQGYYQGVKFALQKRVEIGGVIGSVAEVLQVEKEYSLAIETALGGSLQHIIVENEETGKRGIRLLTQNRAGRATFLPLTTIKPRHINEIQLEGIKKIDGFVGVASDLVHYDLRVANIVQNLLGLTIVAKTLEDATTIARMIRFQFRVVSLDGAVMNQGGSMTGGQNRNQNRTTLFAQNEEITELSSAVQKLENEQMELENALKAKLVVLENEKETLDSLRASGEQARINETKAKNVRENAEKQIETFTQELELFERETKELGRFLADYEERKVLLSEDLTEVLDEKMRLEKEIKRIEQSGEEQERMREEVQNQVHKVEAKLAVLNEQHSHLTSNLEEKSLRQKELNAKKIEYQTLIKTLANNSDENSLTTEEINRQIEQLAQKKEELGTLIENFKVELTELNEGIDELDEQMTQMNRESQELLNRQSKAEVEQNRSEVVLDQLLSYLQEEYALTFEAASMTCATIENTDVAKREVRELKRMIEQLGPVNLAAIEQFSLVSERYEFLTSQRDDLLAAKQSLFDVMTEMDEEVKKRLEETFTQIRKHFRRIFPSMFGGGRADLLLTDPDDLLNTGIEIEAQPPGKKMQNLSLLSGGERALTAIALLFSIIQVRPVPFCVLDEVEAALDEANVARFGHYLAHFEDEMQFIVVTHRKGTMESANVLYGVTMQESGVSKIVSVRLEEVSDDGAFQKEGVSG